MKRIANYIVDNYNKINNRKFKNTEISTKQKLLKIKLRNYSREINLIKILDLELKIVCRARISTILFLSAISIDNQ